MYSANWLSFRVFLRRLWSKKISLISQELFQVSKTIVCSENCLKNYLRIVPFRRLPGKCSPGLERSISWSCHKLGSKIDGRFQRPSGYRSSVRMRMAIGLGTTGASIVVPRKCRQWSGKCSPGQYSLIGLVCAGWGVDSDRKNVFQIETPH